MVKDITDERFGKLIAIRPIKERNSGAVIWECKCDCGNKCLRRGSRLRFAKSNGITSACKECRAVELSHRTKKFHAEGRMGNGSQVRWLRTLWQECGTLYSAEDMKFMELDTLDELWTDFLVMPDDPDIVRFRSMIKHGSISVATEQQWSPPN